MPRAAARSRALQILPALCALLILLSGRETAADDRIIRPPPASSDDRVISPPAGSSAQARGGGDVNKRECDELAASPDDERRVGKGVDKIKVGLASYPCRIAAETPPIEPRYQFQYGRILEAAGRPNESFQQYMKAAQKGYPLAMDYVGYAYYNGEGVARNPAEAVRWYRQAADRGNMAAMSHLGFVAQAAGNLTEAVRWYRKAAEGGGRDGMYNLGVNYYNGHGVAQNKAEGVRWMKLAAAKGHKDAAYAVDRIAREESADDDDAQDGTPSGNLSNRSSPGSTRARRRCRFVSNAGNRTLNNGKAFTGGVGTHEVCN
jgi:tetratricopeptide (TPR) repeat protein